MKFSITRIYGAYVWEQYAKVGIEIFVSIWTWRLLDGGDAIMRKTNEDQNLVNWSDQRMEYSLKADIGELR